MQKYFLSTYNIEARSGRQSVPRQLLSRLLLCQLQSSPFREKTRVYLPAIDSLDRCMEPSYESYNPFH